MFIEKMLRQPYLDIDDGANLGGEPTEPVTPTEPTEPVEPTEVMSTEDEFEEILYNKEPVKIPKAEAKKYLQMGYHYENKVQSKLTEYENEVQRRDEFVKRLGYNSFEELEQAQAQRELEEQAAEVASREGMSQEVAMKLIQLERNDAIRQEQEAIRVKQSYNLQEKESLKVDPFFSKIAPMVEETLKVNPTLSYKAVYNYIAGEKRSELLAQEKEMIQKRTIADIHDKRSRGITEGGDGEPEPDVELTTEGKTMAAAFGNDVKEIAKYVKNKLKK